MAIEDWMPPLAEHVAGIEGLEMVYFPDPNDSNAAICSSRAFLWSLKSCAVKQIT